MQIIVSSIILTIALNYKSTLFVSQSSLIACQVLTISMYMRQIKISNRVIKTNYAMPARIRIGNC